MESCVFCCSSGLLAVGRVSLDNRICMASDERFLRCARNNRRSGTSRESDELTSVANETGPVMSQYNMTGLQTAVLGGCFHDSR